MGVAIVNSHAKTIHIVVTGVSCIQVMTILVLMLNLVINPDLYPDTVEILVGPDGAVVID